MDFLELKIAGLSESKNQLLFFARACYFAIAT